MTAAGALAPPERRPACGFADRRGLLALLERAFAFMLGRIEPPGSLRTMDAAALARKAAAERLFLATADGGGAGCVFCQPRAGCLYVGRATSDAEGAAVRGRCRTRVARP